MIAPTLLITLAFGIGLFFQGAQSYIYAPALICLITGLVLLALPGACRKTTLPKASPALFLLALWVYVTISLLWSMTPFPSLITYLVFSCLPLTFFALLASPRREACVVAAGAGLQAALTGLAAWAVIQVSFFADRFGDRAAYPLLNANNLAALMTMGLMPALALALTADGKAKRIVAALSALLLFAGLVATESRGGLLSCAAVTPFLLFTLRRSLNFKNIALMLVVIAAVMGAQSLHSKHGGAAARLSALASIKQDADAMNRPILWKATLGMIAANPLTGTGFGSFYLVYPSHRPVQDTRSAGQWAHNDPLQFAAEMGIAAPLLLYAFLASLIFRQWEAVRTPGTDDSRKALLAGPLFGFMAMILHTHIEFHLYLMPVLIVSGVWLAGWYVQSAMLLPAEASWQPLSPHGWQKPGYAAIVLVMASLFAIPALRGGGATYYLMQAISEMRKGHPKTFAALLDKSDAWGPGSFIDAKVQHAGLYIDLLNTPDGFFTPGEQQTMARDVLDILDGAERTAPFWGEVNGKRAALYVAMKRKLSGDWEAKAEGELQTALRKNPLDLKARARLIEMLMARGQAEPALTLLNEGLERPHPAVDNSDMLGLKGRLEKMVALKKDYESRTP